MTRPIWKIATYRVREDRLAVVIAAVERFVRAVSSHEPATFYRGWQRRDDPLSFVHIMGFSDVASEEAHRGAEYTDAFVEVIYPSCEEEPTFVDLRPLGEE